MYVKTLKHLIMKVWRLNERDHSQALVLGQHVCDWPQSSVGLGPTWLRLATVKRWPWLNIAAIGHGGQALDLAQPGYNWTRWLSVWPRWLSVWPRWSSVWPRWPSMRLAGTPSSRCAPSTTLSRWAPGTTFSRWVPGTPLSRWAPGTTLCMYMRPALFR